MKRACDVEASSSGSSAKKRKVDYATFEKWKRELDRDCQTVSWLDCCKEKSGGKNVVVKLKCKVCTAFKSKIEGRKNFSSKWIEGADSVRLSNVRDHAQNDQHTHAMHLLKIQHAKIDGLGPSSYSQIVHAFTKLSEEERDKLRVKFDISYFVASENLPLTKYSKLCDLERRHGVCVGNSYTNDNSGKEMIHFTAETMRQDLRKNLDEAKFFSVVLDGSADKGNIDNEAMLLIWCDQNGIDEKIHTRMEYFTVIRPQAVTGEGLFHVLESALQHIGIEEISTDKCKKLVGIGTDGASANVAARGLKGQVEARLDWIFWMWCLAHRLELSIKDTLKSTSFDAIDELLLRLYYLYEKSPKKCRELEDLVNDLKDCFECDDGGIRPLRANGTRWVAHKLNAMKRVVAKYGAYTAHIAALSMDRSVTPADRAKLKGYHTKWTDAKYVLGCALYVDLLKPCAIFSTAMQSKEVDILGAMNGVVKTLRELEKLSQKPLDEWPLYAATVAKCMHDEDEGRMYQSQTLKRFSEATTYYSTKCEELCQRVGECIKCRLSWTDLELIRDIIFVLSSHGWEKIVTEEEDLSSIDRLVTRFATPLQGAGATIEDVKVEFSQMIEYAVQYIAVSSLDYHSVWWRLFHAPCSEQWSNALALVELLFSLPASNGKLERVFSSLKNIKVDKRTRLSNQTLDDLLLIKNSELPLSKFSPDASIDLWWQAKVRRPTQKERKKYKPRRSSKTTSGPSLASGDQTDSESDGDVLEHWDNLFCVDSD